jgi:AraC-like DNA-binding protein/mannose-6-phosphate isomerase-like protein (cupin superfamily)
MPHPPTALKAVGNLLGKLKEPPTLFAGLTLQRTLIPDNIVFFQRTDPERLRSVLGVSSNYHHRFELVVVFHSSGVATVGETTFEMQPGECVLLFPHQFHRFENRNNSAIKWLFVTFELAETEGLASLRDRSIVMDDEALSSLRKLLMVRLRTQEKKHDPLEIVYTLSQLLRHLVKCRSAKPVRRSTTRTDDLNGVILEKINRVVRSNLSKSPKMKELAVLTGYSVSHLRFVFREQFGISLGRYVRESRLAEAAKLLQLTDLQVTEVAKKAGFESLVAFSRSFKNAYHLSPLAYVKLVRKGELPATGRDAEW